MNYKEYATRVSEAVNELRGKVYHSFEIRVTAKELEDVSKKYDITVQKLSRYVTVRTRAVKKRR
tara:strand:+ start:865 stop:1056 length:192 start_codon:yes stop_codon:yes gene_type:complete